ncbi:urease subunit gamma [Roseospira marina]|uniref:Urease subunit beta n=1 Tax=Roseospira marina TaxID=140057 RepID=A0A5M6III0_9PROT|nr:urease subunit gamma [Roseospira marina]KAA5607495.1 urease subunit gamma [Roseospira marina]MBB4312324.1 urease subunit gamma/beta [Roseospira marina]MBB5085660.1 urease subunit gamma/beta [Roseospira marina]
MKLTPRETDKLMVAMAALVARRRLDRGVLLNHPEAVALISDAVTEAARDGRSIAEAAATAASVLTRDQVMDGVPEMIETLQIDALFPDGVKVVTIRNPIRTSDARVRTGQVIPARDPVTLNADRPTRTLTVKNTGDRPIEVGSHYHFAETNPALSFDRDAARGYRLDVPAGARVRFDPGESRTVALVAYGGRHVVTGFRGLVDGAVED